MTQKILIVISNLLAEIFNKKVEAIGIGVPSVVDRKKGIVYNVSNIPAWEEVYLKRYIENIFEVPVFLDNDANCFAMAEKIYGKGKNYNNFVGITLGTGLGGGIIQRGSLMSDANTGSGEFGMIPYKDADYETYCSSMFFEKFYNTTGFNVFQNCEKGETQALKIMEEFGKNLSDVIKMIVLAVDPEMIVIGGNISKGHKYYEQTIYKHFNGFAYPKSLEKLKIEFSELENSGIYGASALCFQK